MSVLFPWQSQKLDRLLMLAVLWGAWWLLVWLFADKIGGGRDKPTVSNKKAIGILCGLIMAFVAVYGWLALTRHYRFNSTGYDLAIHEQIVWNTLNGRFFASSPEVDNSFGDHFRPFLLVLVPIYALFQKPQVLLIAQTVALASGAVPLYWLAVGRLKSRFISLCLVASYLLYPAVGFVNRFDFHTEVFVIPAFIGAFWALEREKIGWLTFFLVVPLLCKETMGLSVAGVGVYVWLTRPQLRRLGIFWVAAGVATFAITSFWLIPTVRGESADALSRYAWLGDSPVQMLQTMIAQPLSVWFQITDAPRLLYLLQLLLPVGFVALLGARALIPALPGLGLNLLAQHFCQPSIYCQYSAPVTPFVFVAAVFGLDFLLRWGERRVSLLAVGMIVLAIGAFWVDNPILEQDALPSALDEIGNAAVVRDALAVVPEGKSLVTTNDYAPYLAQREGLFIVGVPSQRTPPVDPEVVFINLYDQDFIVCDQIQAYVSQLDIDRYGTTFRTGGLIVIERDNGSADTFRDFILNWNNCAG